MANKVPLDIIEVNSFAMKLWQFLSNQQESSDAKQGTNQSEIG